MKDYLIELFTKPYLEITLMDILVMLILCIGIVGIILILYNYFKTKKIIKKRKKG